jgi:ornithine cyclodeaminase
MPGSVLVERLTGNREFLAGTLDDVMSGRVTVPGDRPVVIDGFFHELSRYGS